MLSNLYAMLAASLGATARLGGYHPRPGNWGRQTGTDLRNPADPIQAARIEAAAAKRARRADDLQHYAMRSDTFNKCITNDRHFFVR